VNDKKYFETTDKFEVNTFSATDISRFFQEIVENQRFWHKMSKCGRFIVPQKQLFELLRFYGMGTLDGKGTVIATVYCY
jgi:hypothetical protein